MRHLRIKKSRKEIEVKCENAKNILSITLFCRHVLGKGSSIKWFEALESLTGKKQISVDALLEYYDPVYLWLKNYVEKHNVFVGW